MFATYLSEYVTQIDLQPELKVKKINDFPNYDKIELDITNLISGSMKHISPCLKKIQVLASSSWMETEVQVRHTNNGNTIM